MANVKSMQARKKGRSTNFPEFLSEELQVFLAGREPGQPMLRVSSFLIKDFKCQCFSPLKKYRDEVDLGLPCLKNWDR